MDEMHAVIDADAHERHDRKHREQVQLEAGDAQDARGPQESEHRRHQRQQAGASCGTSRKSERRRWRRPSPAPRRNCGRNEALISSLTSGVPSPPCCHQPRPRSTAVPPVLPAVLGNAAYRKHPAVACPRDQPIHDVAEAVRPETVDGQPLVRTQHARQSLEERREQLRLEAGFNAACSSAVATTSSGDRLRKHGATLP